MGTDEINTGNSDKSITLSRYSFSKLKSLLPILFKGEIGNQTLWSHQVHKQSEWTEQRILQFSTIIL